MGKSDWKIKVSEHDRYYSKNWLVLEDGGSGRWQWVAGSGPTYIVIEINDMPEACGSDASELWVAEVSVVDLATADDETVSFLRCHVAAMTEIWTWPTLATGCALR